ncbi:MAG: DNA internalization-related competence protein ComEC/Rec2 [Armatimonadota bacterium]|nr:DNA internalization-related competence protein ComEC/Rec2 [Armatimonadota bacterium]
MHLSTISILAAAYAAGIGFSNGFLLSATPLFWSGLMGMGVAAVAARFSPRLILASLIALAFVLGAFSEASDRAAHPNVLRPWAGRRIEVTGVVTDEPQQTAQGGWMHRVRVTAVQHRGKKHRLSALLLLRTSAKRRIPAGHLVRASGWLRPVRGRVNFGSFDYARYAARQHLYHTMAARDPFVRDLGPAGSAPWNLALSLRERIVQVHQQALPAEDAALLNSILFGSRATPVSDSIERDFRRSGLTHLLVASGTQVTAFVGLFLLLRYACFLPAWSVALLALCGACLYGAMAGGGPAIARAGVMAVAFALGRAMGRAVDFLSALALAAVLLMWVQPAVLFDLGFQLSFAAVWGLAVLQPWLAKHLSFLPSFTRLLASASIAAQLATAPLLAYHLCQVTPVGVVANLAAVPLAGLLLVGGTVGALVGVVSPAASYLVDTLNLPLLAALRGTAWVCARLPGAHFWVTPPSLASTACCFLTLAALPHLTRQRLARCWANKTARLTATAAAAFCFGWLAASSLLPGRTLTITFFDVGQGDSILVQGPSGRTLLVDGGGADGDRGAFGERVLLPALLHRGARRLHAVLATHSHADHVGGLKSVVSELPVASLWYNGFPGDTPEMDALEEAAARRSLSLRVARAGTAWMLDVGTRVTVLHPPADLVEAPNPNAGSVVLRIDYGDASFLLTADADHEVEEALLLRENGEPTDVLKVAHHGSASASSQTLLQALRPRLAVISVGADNLYGLPSPQALTRLLGSGALLFRTDEDGAVEVVTDGATLRVRCARHPRTFVWLPAR